MIINSLNFGNTFNIEAESVSKEFTTPLGNTLILEIYYNMMDGFLYMDAYKEGFVSIFKGKKLTQRINLFKEAAHLFDNKINIIILPSSDSVENDEVTIENFGESLRMYVHEESL